jgi:hypothetical protein
MPPSKRDRIWDAMSREQKLHYLETTKDKGNKRYVVPVTRCFYETRVLISGNRRLDFRFAH